MIKTTAQAEAERVNNRKSWGLYGTVSLAEAAHKARDMGWEDKKVQLRAELINNEYYYFVEPFERDCNCPNILKFDDFFDRKPATNEG